MSKRSQRVRNRRILLEGLAETGMLFCTKHQKVLDPRDIRMSNCYTGNHGKTTCKYLRGYE